MNTCSQCGSNFTPGEAFCDNCGADLTAAPVVPPQPVPVAPPSPPVGGGITCNSCSAQNPPDAAFCDNCGNQLSGQATPPPVAPPSVAAAPPPPVAPPPVAAAAPPPPVAAAAPPPPAPVVANLGHFVVDSTQQTIQIPAGKPELIMGRSDAQSSHTVDIDLDPHGGVTMGVSRVHAKLHVSGSQVIFELISAVNNNYVNGGNLMTANQQFGLVDDTQIQLGNLKLTYKT